MSARLRIEGLTKRFGGLVVTDDLMFDVPAGSLSAIIGPNGAGKTTLFNLITGNLRPDSGEIWLDDVPLVGRSTVEIIRLGIGRAFQVASLFPTFTVQDAVAAAVAAHTSKLSDSFGPFPRGELREGSERVLDLMGLSTIRNQVCATLSHGDQKLVDIALAVALEPKVLLLDEPTAGMGREERRMMVACIQRLWQRAQMTLVFIEHDMDIVFSVAQTVRVLRQGAMLAEGLPDAVRRNPAVIEAYLGSEG